MEEELKTNETNIKGEDLEFKPTYKVIPLNEEEKKKQREEEKGKQSKISSKHNKPEKKSDYVI